MWIGFLLLNDLFPVNWGSFDGSFRLEYTEYDCIIPGLSAGAEASERTSESAVQVGAPQRVIQGDLWQAFPGEESP